MGTTSIDRIKSTLSASRNEADRILVAARREAAEIERHAGGETGSLARAKLREIDEIRREVSHHADQIELGLAGLIEALVERANVVIELSRHVDATPPQWQGGSYQRMIELKLEQTREMTIRLPRGADRSASPEFETRIGHRAYAPGIEMSQYPEQTPEERLQAARRWAVESREPVHTPQPYSESPIGGSPAQTHREELGGRLQTVIDAAERAADAIRADAEEQAARHLQQAKQKADRITSERVHLIATLTDDLIEHATNVRDHSRAMSEALDRAVSSISGRLEANDVLSTLGYGEPGPGEAALIESQAPAIPSGAAASQAEPPPAAVLRATQMAVAGYDRDQISAAILAEFNADPEPVIRRVLGE